MKMTEQERQQEDRDHNERGRKMMILCLICFVLGNIGLVYLLVKLFTR